MAPPPRHGRISSPALLTKSGLIVQEKRISDEVMAIHSQVTNIQLTDQDVVSNVTNSILGDQDIEDINTTSTAETKQCSTNGWNCSTMTEAVQQKPVVQQPSNTNTVNMISRGIPTVTYHQLVHSLTHYHSILCSSTTCMTDGVVTTFDLIPMLHSLPKTMLVQSLTSATVHQHHFQLFRKSDVLAQSKNIAREEMNRVGWGYSVSFWNLFDVVSFKL